MILIRITFVDGQKFYINESRKGILLVTDITEAFKYQSTLEFKVTWFLTKYINIQGERIEKEDVINFESINAYTLDCLSFDINEKEIEIGEEIYVDPITFKKLTRCGITSSHWVYDKDDNWIGFPKKCDYDKAYKIKYFRRGLTHTMTSHNNWYDRYDKHSWHGCYEVHHTCMLNPIIQQICLLDLDCCHKFTIYEKKI